MSDTEIPFSEIQLLGGYGGGLSQMDHGSYGKVMKGFWTSEKKIVVVKFVHKSNGDADSDPKGLNESVKEEHLKELANFRKLVHHDHNRVVKFYGTTRSKIGVHVVLEFVEGVSLHSIIEKCVRKEVRLGIEEKVRIALDIADGLKYLHTFVEMVHWDLKPLNILITRDLRAVLCDFGSARDVLLGNTVQVMGTPLYFAPELYGKKKANFSSDVYSFGATLFALFYESPPLDWPLRKFPNVERKNKRTMKQVGRLIKHCVKFKPDERIGMETAVEMLNDIMDDLKNAQLRLVQAELEKSQKICTGLEQRLGKIRSDAERYKAKKKQSKKIKKKKKKKVRVEVEEISVGGSNVDTEVLSEYLMKVAFEFFWGLKDVHIDYDKPREFYDEIVKAGGKLDGKSLYVLGKSYEEGYGVKKDGERSLQYYRQAAAFFKSHNVDNLYPNDWATLGWMYLLGNGFKINIAEGFRLLVRAFESKNVLATYFIGYVYYIGYSVKVDYIISVKFLRKAARAGLPHAMDRLGRCYLHGKGVRPNYKTAADLFLRAAERGLREAMLNIGYRCLNGKGVRVSHRHARKWLGKARDLGCKDVQKELNNINECKIL